MTAPSHQPGLNRPSCEKPEACDAKGKGHCRRCHMRAATKANWQDPEFRARNAAATKANWQDPEFRARNAAAVKAAANRRLSWCPPELIDDYRLLARHLGAAEARRIIERQADEFFADAQTRAA